MTVLAELLAEHRTSAKGDWGCWHERVAEQLAGSSRERIEGEDARPFWIGLGWAEVAASRAVRREDRSLLRLAIAALALVDEAGVIDGRDVRVVGGLLRRACELLGLSIDKEIRAARLLPAVADLDSPFFGWLSAASPTMNTLHEEVGEGASFAFIRKPHSIDIGRLQARFGRPSGNLEEGSSDS